MSFNKISAYKMSFLGGIVMLLSSLTLLSTIASACPLDFSCNDGSWSFNAAIGSSQSKIVTVSGLPGTVVSLATGSNVFTVDQSQVTLDDHGGATFTITFRPGANATGTMTTVLSVTCSMCKESATLEGTVAQSRVTNSLPSNVSFTVTPNPATDNVNVITSGARAAEIGIYDLLGKLVTSEKTTNWKLNATSIAPGSYIVRIAGESVTGEAFVTSRKIIISR
jgi:hypothetical protein